MLKVKLEDFSPVGLVDKKIILPLLLGNDIFFCDYSFANLFMWGDIFKTRWLFLEDRLWIYNGYDDLMLMPVGKALTLPGLIAVSDMLLREGKSGNFVLVDQDFVKDNASLGDFFHVTIDVDNGDYIYSSQKLVDLAGNKLHKKRNLINQFLALYPDHKCLPLQASDLGACLELSEKWCRMRTCLEADFDHETSALKRALGHFSALELQGLKISLGGEMAAFSVFSQLSSNMADVHFEKFAPEIKGSGQVINWETAKFLSAKYKYINREQDLGIQGLRQAKKSYDPEYIVSAYFLERKK
ncbi:MAG: phosphatidylglycerol lysyltransferase domain-containing protein [Candidatus Aminicenantes bacterium]|nr:phosphatidylglycerol lysyltransferase domain-containing protein [Candidatus Aminicenantes bacterium]